MNFGIIVAAGKSERMGPDVDKAFLSVGTKPVLAYSLQAFEKCEDIDGVVLVVRKDRVDAARGLCQMFGCFKVRRIVAGGATRQLSVTNGLDALVPEVKIVAIHDGARPCVTPELISLTIDSAKRYGSGVAGYNIRDTVKSVDKGAVISKTLDRSKLWAVQTPQTFKRELLTEAFDMVIKKKAAITDEASAVEMISDKVRLVPAPLWNIKITTPEDIAFATALLRV